MGGGFERLATVRRGDDVRALGAQQYGEDLADIRGVLNDEDSES